MLHGSDLVIKTVEQIKNGTTKTSPQEENSEIRTAYKLNKDNCKIDWTKPIDAIHNLVRGLSPYPAAWSTLYNNEEKLDVKIYKTEKLIELHSYTIGQAIVSKKELKIAVKEGFIKILEIKLPGKRTMDVISLLNGFNFEKDAKML